MEINNYTPKPIDTSHIVMSEDLLQLAERMAENVHDVWAATRIAQGWTYGPERDDANKKHKIGIATVHSGATPASKPFGSSLPKGL